MQQLQTNACHGGGTGLESAAPLELCRICCNCLQPTPPYASLLLAFLEFSSRHSSHSCRQVPVLGVNNWKVDEWCTQTRKYVSRASKEEFDRPIVRTRCSRSISTRVAAVDIYTSRAGLVRSCTQVPTGDDRRGLSITSVHMATLPSSLTVKSAQYQPCSAPLLWPRPAPAAAGLRPRAALVRAQT